jgi:hypothetical protein
MILQTAYAQTVRDQDANKWIVYDRDQNRLGELPARLTDQEAMHTLVFAREFENKAFHAGVEEGLRRGKQAADLRVNALRIQMDDLARENERLATILERHLEGD